MRKLLQKIITLFTFLLFFLFLLDFGFSSTACTANTQACEACNSMEGNSKEQCIIDVNEKYRDHNRPTASDTNSPQTSSGGNQGATQNRLGDIYNEINHPDTSQDKKEILEQEKNAHLFCLTSDTCYYDEDTKKFKLNDFAIDTPLSVSEINARAELDRIVNLHCTPGTSSYNPDTCNTQLEDITGLNSGKWWEASDQDRAESHLVGERWGWFWYLFQGEDAAATFTLNKYGVNFGFASEEELEDLSEPIFSRICLNNNDMDLEDIRPSFTNEVNDTINGESLFDFRGSVTNLIPIDEDLIEGEGYVKYSYYFKKPEKSAIGDFDDEELQTLSKRNIAVVLFYNKMNRSDDDDDFDVYGYYEVISDPDVIELNSENPIISSGIELIYADEVYLPDPNFRIAFYL